MKNDLPRIGRREKIRKKGVVYCATAPKPTVFEDFIYSVISLRDVYSGPVTLFTDLPDHVTRRTCDAFDVERVPVSIDLTGRFRSRYLKTQLAQLTPYERTVFVDSDTIFMRNIDALFDHELGFALDARSTIGDSLEYLQQLGDDGMTDAESELTRDCCPSNFPHFNSGVIAWKSSNENDNLFRLWVQQWSRFRGRDQAALTRALVQSRQPVTRLASRFNYFAEYGKPSSNPETTIYHACKPLRKIVRRHFPNIRNAAKGLIRPRNGDKSSQTKTFWGLF